MKNTYSINYTFHGPFCFNNFYFLFKCFWFSCINTNLSNRRLVLLTSIAYCEQDSIVLVEDLSLYTSDLEKALAIFKEILNDDKTRFKVEEIKFIFSFNNDPPSINYKYICCNTNKWSYTYINILIIIFTNLILNISITLGLLHLLKIIDINDLFNIGI